MPSPASLAPVTMPAFAEAPDERARMGRISGVLWILASLITVGNCYLPGAQHVAIGWVFALSGGFFASRSHLGSSRRESDETPIALLILDLDDFKRINSPCKPGATIANSSPPIRARVSLERSID